MGTTKNGRQGWGQADTATSGRRRGTPETRKPFLVSARKWVSLTGWNRSILLCKIGSLVTPETRTIFILNSCVLEYHLPPISCVPLKDTKKKKKKGSLWARMTSETVWLFPGIRSPSASMAESQKLGLLPSWPSRSFRTRRKKHSCSGVLTRFSFKIKFSLLVRFLQCLLLPSLVL